MKFNSPVGKDEVADQFAAGVLNVETFQTINVDILFQCVCTLRSERIRLRNEVTEQWEELSDALGTCLRKRPSPKIKTQRKVHG